MTETDYDPTPEEVTAKAREHNISMAEAKRVMLASHRLSTRIAQKRAVSGNE